MRLDTNKAVRFTFGFTSVFFLSISFTVPPCSVSDGIPSISFYAKMLIVTSITFEIDYSIKYNKVKFS